MVQPNSVKDKVALVTASWDGVRVPAYQSHMRLVSRMVTVCEPDKVLFIVNERKPIPYACIGLVSSALDHGAEWVLYIDDDCTPPPDAFEKLYEQADPESRPIVAGLGFFRYPPYWPSIFKYDRWADVYSVSKPMPVAEWKEGECYEVDATGFCAILIHRDVFKKIGKPWFDQSDSYSPDGYFMGKCAKARIPIYCHTGVKVGHCRDAVVCERDFKRWCEARGGSEAAEKFAIQKFRLKDSSDESGAVHDNVWERSGIDEAVASRPGEVLAGSPEGAGVF